jgi:hypothetical protein
VSRCLREGLFRNRSSPSPGRHDAYMTNPPPGSYPPPPQPLYAQQLIPGWEQRTQGRDGGGGGAGGGGATVGGGGDDGPFLEAFDFSFDRYATPAVAKVFYMVIVIFCVLTYVGSVIMAFLIFIPDKNLGGYTTTSGSAFPGFLTLVLGWIPAFLTILGTRLALEQALASVRTAVDARALRRRYVGAVDG